MTASDDPRAGAETPGAEPIEEDRLAELLFVSAGVAHEVLNPLGYVQMALYELQQRLRDPCVPEETRVEGERLLDMAHNGLDRVSSVVNDLRAYALRESSPRPAVVDLHENIRRTVRLLLLRRPDDVNVHVDLCEDGHALCRPARMNQVFFNLILNALQAVGDRGDVWVRTWAEGDQLRVSVRDSGPGIPPEHLGKLFRPFFTTKDRGRASGLGLALSFRIVREHGGDIHVRSEAGKGAEFTVSVPRGA